MEDLVEVLAAQVAAMNQQHQDHLVQVAAAANAANANPPAAAAAGAAAVAANRGYKKLTVFSSGDGAEWLVWKRNLRLAAQINDWDEARSLREAAASMEGSASRMVGDIDPNREGLELDDLLAEYEARFLPAAATDVARVNFRYCCQYPEESVLEWHGRCRELYVRSHPNGVPEEDAVLRDQFLMGLTNKRVGEHAWNMEPATYAAALVLASRNTSGKTIFSRHHASVGQGLQIKKEGLFEINQQRTNPRDNTNRGRPTTLTTLRCFYCDKLGHLKRDCRAAAADRRKEQKRKNPRFRAKERNDTVQQVAAIEDEELHSDSDSENC